VGVFDLFRRAKVFLWNEKAGTPSTAAPQEPPNRLNESKGALSPATPQEPLHELRYSDGVHHFEKGELDLALAAFTEFLDLTHQSAIIAPDTPLYGLRNVNNYGDFEKAFQNLLDEKFREWETNQQPFPRYLKSLADAQSPQDQAKGKRILFLIPQHIMSSKQFIECDFEDHLLETAANAGADVDVFYTDRCSYPDINLDPEVSKAELELLAAKIEAWVPDVIVFDGNYLPSKDTLNPAYLEKLKAKCGFKLIVFIGDAWGSHWVPAGDKWGEVCDLIFHFAPETPLATEGKYPEKLFWSAYPVNKRNFFQDAVKKYDISFVGTYVSVLRPFWLTIALKIAKDLNLNHRLLPHKRAAGVALTMEEYATVLRQTKMVLNFSTRLGPLKAMTGRTWQALTAGTVLLEEENSLISAYFVPFVHYIPFSTQNELAYSIEFFSRNPHSALKVGNAASAFCKSRYSSEAIWSRLVAAVYARGLQD
jgi:hypothetical protein